MFSVIVPLFNRQDSIRACLLSVLGQTYSNIEVLVIDDGSTDQSASVVSAIDDPRISYHYQANAGGAAARNFGIKLARGKYIAFLDSDDVFSEDHLEQAFKFLTGSDICYFSKVRVDRGSGVFFEKPARGPLQGEDFSEYLFCAGGFVPTITLVVPADLAKSTLYTSSLKYGQDKDFALRLAKNGATFIFNDRVSAIWYDRPVEGRISGNIDPCNRLSWLEANRGSLTDRAYYSDLGWSVAKAFSARGMKVKAMSYYVSALFRRCYSPKTALVVFLQIFCTQAAYRRFADFASRLGFKP